MKNISVCELRFKIEQCFLKYGLSDETASQLAKIFVAAEEEGVTTHGLMVLPSYLKKIKNGHFNLKPVFRLEKQTSAFSVVDADNAIGPISAKYCMDLAVEKSAGSGVHFVFCRNANTYGLASYYTEIAAQAGMIGITFCNSPAAMTFSNSNVKLLGTNPFSVCIPAGDEPFIIFDMATSVVAKSKINEARIQGNPIPEGWALDEHGNPTTDPEEAIRGSVLPMAGYKGAGLAFVFDILSGFISGAASMSDVGKFYSDDGKCMNVGQTFIAIDTVQIYGENFHKDIGAHIKKIRESSTTDGNLISLPGDNRHIIRNSVRENGMAISDEIYELLHCGSDCL